MPQRNTKNPKKELPVPEHVSPLRPSFAFEAPASVQLALRVVVFAAAKCILRPLRLNSFGCRPAALGIYALFPASPRCPILKNPMSR